MRKHTVVTVFAAFIGVLAAGAIPLQAQLQDEAGFIAVESSVSYFHVGSYFYRIPMRTSPARIWYTFQPADEDATAKPLFVFYNGGPGGATSCGLFSASTARLTVVRDETTGEAAIVTNPASWTRAGNLLHIDARTAGFSYSLMDDPGNAVRRGREFDAQNYNSFVDGADFVRVLLKFLADHPSIRANRVVLVPESYGGIRTLVMLNMLLYSGRYADGSSIYQDPGLVSAIRAHFDAVFQGQGGADAPPAVVAGQFGHQVLIQTVESTPYQRRVAARMLEEPGSPLYQVAAETGVPYVRYADSPGAVANPGAGTVLNYIHAWLDSVNRNVYHMAKPSDYFNGQRAAATGFLTQVGTLSLMTGVDVTEIPDLYATARSGAYKMRAQGVGTGLVRTWSPALVQGRTPALTGRLGNESPGFAKRAAVRRRAASTSPASSQPKDYDFSALVGPPPGQKELAAWLAPAAEDDMAAVFGSLPPWDRFFIDTNHDVTTAFAYNKVTLRNYPLYFNNSTLYGRLFLENAAWVETFATNAAWDSVVYTAALPEALAMHTDILSAAQLDPAGPPGTARPGQIVLSYLPSTVPGSSATTRTIRFPSYLQSGHAVTMSQPLDMLEDVIEWLAAIGVPARGR